jgi:hypothetical protein
MARYRRFDFVTTVTEPDALEGVRLRRAGLRSAMTGVEQSLAAAVPGREADWVVGVRDALGVLQEVWTRHVVETETPGAFLDELVEHDPRLANGARRLREEHGSVLSELLSIEDLFAAVPVDPEAVRARLLSLLCDLAKHRQRGADLVYEAYDVDIGGGS